MKIALITFDFPPDIGGVQNYLFELSQRIATAHELLVITMPKSGRENGRFPVQTVPNRRFWHFWRALQAYQPDKVLIGHAHPQLLLAAYLYGRSYLTFTHGDDFMAAQPHWHKPMFNFLLSRSNPLVTTTQVLAGKLKTLNMPAPYILPPAVDPRQLVPASQRSKSYHLLTVARLVPSKGVDAVLQALPAVLDAFPSAHYTIVGEGESMPDLKNLASSLGISASVTFAGRVVLPELLQFYQSAALFVMPARDEAFGIVYLEAAACGLPVIAGRTGGVAEAVREGETAVVVRSHDVQETAAAIIYLFSERERAEQMGVAGRQWVEAEMNWDSMATRLLALL